MKYRNSCASAALLLSAGLSLYTISALPRGGVARQWLSINLNSPEASEAPARASVFPPRTEEPSSALGQQAAQTASGFEGIQDAGSSPRGGAIAASAARADVGRPDSLSMVVSRGAADPGFARAGAGGAVGVADSGGLEAFSWQSAPDARDALNAYQVNPSTETARRP